MRERSDFTYENMTPSLQAERRQQVRIQLNMHARIEGVGLLDIDATILDISTGGANIQTRHVGLCDVKELTVTFRLGATYQITAVPVWWRHHKGVCFMGVQWINLHSNDEERLKQELMRIAVNRRRMRK